MWYDPPGSKLGDPGIYSVIRSSGGGTYSELGGGLFKFSGYICMEKITILWSDTKNTEGRLQPPSPPFPPPMSRTGPALVKQCWVGKLCMTISNLFKTKE